MFTLFGIGFTAPWLLLGLAALPILWILLRAVPPAPVLRTFPGVALLLGLEDDESQTDRTPPWLLALRILAVAAMIVGFAGPVLNPRDDLAGRNPVLVLFDGTWASAPDWSRRIERAGEILDDAHGAGRPAAVAALTDLPRGEPRFRAADAWAARLASVQPAPWEPDAAEAVAWAEGLSGDFDTVWVSDGLAREGRDALLAALEARGAVSVVESPRASLGLRAPALDGGDVVLGAVRSRAAGAAGATVVARGLDPRGIERELARAEVAFPAGEAAATVALSLPPELRNRVSRFELEGIPSAGAVSLADDTLRRREVALVAGRDDREGLEIFEPTHYLEQALAPTADVIFGDLPDVLPANPDVIVLADVPAVAEAEEPAVLDWIGNGGLLLRFAGPRFAAASADAANRAGEDPLMPVRIRSGGRSIGGPMSWDEPKPLRSFPEESPFFGLAVPGDVHVSTQILAQPGPALAERVVASLTDGTPLVTRKRIGQGQVVLFHVSATAEWSTLPLSGLFGDMLERLAVSALSGAPSEADLAGAAWVAERVLSAHGTLEDAGALAGVPGEALARGVPGPETPPGQYASGDRRIALNVLGEEATLGAASWPARVPVGDLSVRPETGLKGWFLALALALLCLDVLAFLFLTGQLGRLGRGARLAAQGLALGLLALAPRAEAQEADELALRATLDVTLAHVVTGDRWVDDVAFAGLWGLSSILWSRTSIEPARPVSVDLETDELSFFPFLYWPIVESQPIPSDEAYAKLNRYLRGGGMILFDTRDADIGSGGTSANTRTLRRLARPLDIPRLEPVPADHVLTRSFYLLQDFPGRHAGRTVWVEAAPADAERIEGVPFRNLNDNVTPVVIGGNDWASAWAVDAAGNRLFPIGRGNAGERQRELAARFGVNLVMHVLTGNYKSDQVHVPALLERLGN